MQTLQSQLDAACQSIHHEIGIGKVADYIPALAQVPSEKFGAAIVSVTGETATYGAAKESFSIQSLSLIHI